MKAPTLTPMTKRILLGAIMIVALGGLLWFDWFMQTARVWGALAGPDYEFRLILLPMTLVVLLITSRALVEFGRLAAGAGTRILPVATFLGAGLLVVSPILQYTLSTAMESDRPDRWVWALHMLVSFPIMISLIVASAFAEQMIRHRTQDALRRIGGTLLAVMYLGIGGLILIHIRQYFGIPALVLFLAAVKSTDIGAYFTGSALGKHKMIPWLSPGKSWEGLAGGVIVAAVVSAAAVWLLKIDMALGKAALFGVIVGLAGQFADLCESLLKRSANLKDSGALVPEFGGILDIIDSPILAAPVAYLLLFLI